jgi:hypothetical protein
MAEMQMTADGTQRCVGLSLKHERRQKRRLFCTSRKYRKVLTIMQIFAIMYIESKKNKN